MKTTLYLAVFFLLPSIACSAELKPFTSDGCSSFPDGTIDQQSLWANCCIRHDLAYWQGGTYDQRLAADNSLEQCVAQVGEPKIAKLMLAGVRVGGSPYFPTSYRWGYGWPYPRGYKALTAEDKVEIQQKLKMLEIMIQSISQELDLSEK
jgi:hypothetical protein